MSGIITTITVTMNKTNNFYDNHIGDINSFFVWFTQVHASYIQQLKNLYCKKQQVIHNKVNSDKISPIVCYFLDAYFSLEDILKDLSYTTHRHIN